MTKNDPKLFKVESIDIEQIKPYPKNHKIHPEGQIKQLKNSISTTGLNYPLILDKNHVIIAGHGRFEAIKSLGWKKVPVIIRADLTDEEVQAARISDNITASTRYDTSVLADDLRDLFSKDVVFDAEAMGMSDKEIDLLLKDVDMPEIDAIMTDPEAEMQRQDEEDAANMKKADKDEVKFSEVFGFKSLTREQARRISRALAQIEALKEKTGADAVLEALEGFCE